MTCPESRELFSARVDDALGPAERAALDAHLAGCAECRRELAAFERTVALVHAIEPARAPAGFVDRVLGAARPTPWYARLGRRLFVPWPKIPLEAAALLLVAGLAVMLYRGSVEQQGLARYDGTPPRAIEPSKNRVQPTAPPARPEPPAEPRAATPAPAEVPRAMAERPAPPPAVLEGTRAKSDSGAKVETPVSERAQGPVEDKKRAEIAKDSQEPVAGKLRDSVESQVRERAAEPDRFAQSAAKAQPMPQGAAGSVAPLSRTGPATGIPAPPPDVTARLRAADVAAAERALLELAARLGARQTGRRIDGGVVIVELAVPREAYPRFVREAADLGALSIERQATERAVLTVAVAVSN